MLSDKERGQIEAFRQANYSIRKIGKELNRSKTVNRCFKVIENKGNIISYYLEFVINIDVCSFPTLLELHCDQ